MAKGTEVACVTSQRDNKIKSWLWTVLQVLFYVAVVWLLSNANQYFMEELAVIECPKCIAQKLFYEL